MNTTPHVPANYVHSPISRYKGNPFIEALPPLSGTKAEFITAVANYPDPPTTATRALSEIDRMSELHALNDLVFPFPQYQQAGLALAMMLRESYVARNPLEIVDRQRRHALATSSQEPGLYPVDWKSSATGHTLMSISGMGKTTFLNAALLRYPQVVEHCQYGDTRLNCRQIVYLKLSIPHDGTLRSLCLDFFGQIDRMLGTEYRREARSYRTIAPMQSQMIRVANAVSLGTLFLDELQNLRSAKGLQADLVLNMLSNFIEEGIGLFTLCTPAVQSVLEGSVRNARKLTSSGTTFLEPMRNNSPIWQDFCEACWDYTYVKHKARLTKEIVNAWYRASAGNTAFAMLAFSLTQQAEIGGAERVDEIGFERVSVTRMAFLQPAIAALLSNCPKKLMAFDDLIFSERFRALRGCLGVKECSQSYPAETEFDEWNESKSPIQPQSRGRRSPHKGNQEDERILLPMENPLTK